MYSIISSVCIVVIFSGITVADLNYPSDLPKCHKGDNECITEVLQLFATNYSNGIPSINLPSLHPLRIDRIEVMRERKGGLLDAIADIVEYIEWKKKDAKLHGLKNAIFNVTGFEKNLGDSNVVITIAMPNFSIDAEYNLNVKLLKRITQGQGPFKIGFDNFTVRYSFKLKIYEKDDGKQYMKIDQPKVEYTAKSLSDLKLGTLIDGGLEYEFLKKNMLNLLGNIKSETGRAFATAFTNIIDPIFNKFSIDQLFLKDE